MELDLDLVTCDIWHRDSRNMGFILKNEKGLNLIQYILLISFRLLDSFYFSLFIQKKQKQTKALSIIKPKRYAP